MLQILISTARFAHVEGVFACLREAGRIVAVVVYHTAEDGVPESKGGGKNCQLAESISFLYIYC